MSLTLQNFDMELFTSNDSKEVKLSGKISDMFRDTMYTTLSITREQMADMILNKPIVDNDGRTIGKIDSVDVENDTWCATCIIVKGE